MTVTQEKLKNLRLSALDLKAQTDWSDPVIEEFLSIIDSLNSLAVTIDINNNPAYLDFITTLANPSYKKGRVFWDGAKEALSYYNEQSDVTVNLGQEVLIPVYNDTGFLIPNGSLVYPTGETGGRHTIDLADASRKEKSRLVSMVTHDIPDGETGYTTRLGSVGDINTTGLSGLLYLSATIPGTYTDIPPTNGAYIIPIGYVKEVGVNGSITIDIAINELTVEVTDTNGFTQSQRNNTSLSFVDSTRTFTISATIYPFHFYQNGDKYEIENSQSIIIPNTTGMNIIYFDNGVLSSYFNPPDIIIQEIIRNKTSVAYVYWNADEQKSVPEGNIGDERHGISMSPDTHTYLHFTRGAQYLNGLALNNLTIDDDGDLDASLEYGSDSGYFTDEDLLHAVSSYVIDNNIPILYKEGSGVYWKSWGQFDTWQMSTAYSVGDIVLAFSGNAYYRGLIFRCSVAGTSGVTEPIWQDSLGAVSADGGNPCGAPTTDNTVTWICIGSIYSRVKNFIGNNYLPAYNNWNGSAWEQAEVLDGDYFLMHFFATPGLTYQAMLIQGQSTYGNIIAARLGANTELQDLIMAGLVSREFLPIASIIYQADTSYDNFGQGRIRSTDTGAGYVDWRYQDLVPGVGPSSHSNLAGLGSDDHIQYQLAKENTKLISSGIIDATGLGGTIILQAESGTTDQLDRIIGIPTGREVTLIADTGDTITIAHGTYLKLPINFTLTGTRTIKLISRGSDVCWELTRSPNEV